MLEPKQTHDLLSSILAQAKKVAPGADVFLSLEGLRSGNIRFARNEVTSTGEVEESRLTVTVARGKRHASVEVNQLDAASVRAAVERAERMAAVLAEDPEWLPLLPAQRYLTAGKTHDAATERLGAAERAQAAAEAMDAASAKDLVMAGFLEHHATSRSIASTAGISAHHAATRAELTITARTPDGSGSGWGATVGTAFAELDPAAASRRAQEKARRSVKPRRLEPGRYTVVLEPAAVGELLSFLVEALDARRADEGRSFFSRRGGGTRLGERIAGEQITLRSDPTDPRTPGPVFDHDGVPIEPTTWIDRGVVSALRYSRYWAAKQGKRPTGHSRSVLLAPGSPEGQAGQGPAGQGQAAQGQAGPESRAALLAGVDRGVLITRFWYTRWLDPQALLITGLTRDGVFLIENGEITAPVNNFRFNESPVTMLKNADRLAAAVERVPGDGAIRVPALRTHEFNLASISDAV